MTIHSSILAWRIPMDRGAWWPIVHGVAKSQTPLTKHTAHIRPWCQILFLYSHFVCSQPGERAIKLFYRRRKLILRLVSDKARIRTKNHLRAKSFPRSTASHHERTLCTVSTHNKQVNQSASDETGNKLTRCQLMTWPWFQGFCRKLRPILEGSRGSLNVKVQSMAPPAWDSSCCLTQFELLRPLPHLARGYLGWTPVTLGGPHSSFEK